MSNERDIYTVLGVSSEASEEEIHDACLRVSRVVHPDRFDSTKQPLEWKQANEMLRDAQESFGLAK